MTPEPLYAAGETLEQLCLMLELDRDKVIRAAGLTAARLAAEEGRVTEEEFFALWDALMDAANIPTLPVDMARTFAHGPFTPSLLAFSCSPDVRHGLQRLSVFKPLMGPLNYLLSETETTLEIAVLPARRAGNMPTSLALFELVFIVECCRVCTTRQVTPLEVGLPEAHPALPAATDYFGIAPQRTERPKLTLARADAERQLISENPHIWDVFEPGLRRQLAAQRLPASYASRVRNLLLELLPGGAEVTIDVICERLKLSRRSLQRHLQAEGKGFQTLVQETRVSLAEHYLADDAISISEIAYLLGYQDPNSFFRSFRQWTGLTPNEARLRRTGGN